MTNKKALDYLEQNFEGVNNMIYFMKYPDELTCDELMLEIEIDHFSGYEWLLPIMLLSSEDPVIERTGKRLLLQLYNEKLQTADGRQIVERVAGILTDEKEKWDKKTKRLRKLDQENKI